MLQKKSEEKDWSDQKVQELEGALGLAMQSIKYMDARIQALHKYKHTKGRSKDSPNSVGGG